MRALVVDATADRRIALREVPEPTRLAGDALVEVRAISLNRGEMRMLRTAPDGFAPGWDFAGVLAEDVAEWSAGTAVVGIVEGGSWAQRVAVRPDWLAVVPAGVDVGIAAAIPTAGLTALRTLRLARAGLGDRVLITGATGGVGRFAVQLAERLGAEVIAVAADPGSVEGTFDVILESAGGPMLARALTALDVRGRLVTFGNSSDLPTTFDARDVYNGALIQILGFELFFDPTPFGADLTRLVNLVAEGHLVPPVAAELPWERMPEALDQLAERGVGGKIVLRIAE